MLNTSIPSEFRTKRKKKKKNISQSSKSGLPCARRTEEQT
jgi:hypothetical protein